MKKAALLLLMAGLAWGDIVTLPGGSNGAVQVNKRGAFAGDSSLVYSTSTHILTVPTVDIGVLTSSGTSWRFPTAHVGGGSLIDDGSGNLTVGTPSVIAISSGSNISVFDGGVQISTALGSMVMNATQFRATLSGGTTVSFALDSSSVTLLGQTINIGNNTDLSVSSPLIRSGSSLRVDGSSVTMLGPTINLGGTGVTGTVLSTNLPGTVVYSNTTQNIDGVKTISSSLTVTHAAGIATTQVVAATITATSGIVTSSFTLNGPMSLTYLRASGPQVSTVTFGLDVGSMTVRGPTNGQSFAYTGPALSSVTYGLSVGSMTIVNGVGVLDFALVATPTAQVGAATVYASSTTGMLHENPNNEGDFSVVISSINPVLGHLVKFSSRAKLIDGGLDSGVIVPSTFSWTLNYPLIANSTVTVQGGSMTVVAPGFSITHVSTETADYEYYSVVLSTFNVGRVLINDSAGTSGQVFTSQGANKLATWTTPSAGGGGGGSSIAFGTGTIAGYTGTIASSPTTVVLFNNSYFTASLQGGSTVFITPAQPFPSTFTAVSNPSSSNAAVIIASGSPNTGTFYQPDFFQAYSTNNGRACYGFLQQADSPGGFQPLAICRQAGNDTMEFGFKSASGGLSNWITLTTNGSAPQGSTTTVSGDLIVSGGEIESPAIKNTDIYGMTVSSGFFFTPTVITSTSTITSTMSVVYASCTTRGAAPTPYITLNMSPAQKAGEWHRFYNVGADSCSIRIAGNATDLIESTGVWRLDAQSQHCYMESLGGGLWGGDCQATPWSVFTTQDDVGAFAVATSSLATQCPIYINTPIALTGFRVTRSANAGWFSADIRDMNNKYIVGVSTQLTVSGANNYMTGGVTQLAKGWYRMDYTANNTAMTITGSNTAASNKMFCGSVGTLTTGLDLSQFTPAAVTANTSTYPAIDLIFNGGLQGY